jgi:hypothetical protein
VAQTEQVLERVAAKEANQLAQFEEESKQTETV